MAGSYDRKKAEAVSRRYPNVWDAIGKSPGDAAKMKMRRNEKCDGIRLVSPQHSPPTVCLIFIVQRIPG